NVLRQSATLVTLDGGGKWFEVGTGGVGNVQALKVDPRHAGIVYAVAGTSVYQGRVSTNAAGGPTSLIWQDITGSGMPGTSLYTIAVEPEGAGTDAILYVGTDNGVYASRGSFSVWHKFGAGLPNAMVTDLELRSVSATGPTILGAGTYGRGMWE